MAWQGLIYHYRSFLALPAKAKIVSLNEGNTPLIKANQLGELMARDALERNESCGGHFREESQTEEGEALRDDDNYSHVSAWEFQGPDREPAMHKEPLHFEHVKPGTRSYK